MPPPDASLHPEATGYAKETVDAHSKDEPLKFYSGWFCPFVQRVWVMLEEKQIPYQYIEVNPYHKDPEFLKLNPRGLVPTLQAPNGRPLYESTVLCEYLEEAYPSNTPRFLPEDPFDRARARIWTDYVTSRVIPAFHRFLQYQPSSERDGAGDPGLDERRQEFLSCLLTFTREMDEEGPYFAGSEMSLVDLIMAPWAVRLWIFDHFKGGLGIPEPEAGDQNAATWARWRKWVETIESRESIRKTSSDREHFLPIYQRYADNTAQSELAKATRSGRGVP